MNNYSVDKLLVETPEIVLPACTFCESRCYECIYFMKHEKVDSEGKSRCSYHWDWRYPSDGCGNGKDRWTYQKEMDEQSAKEAEERRKREEADEHKYNPYSSEKTPQRHTPSYRGSSSKSERTGGTGSAGGLLILLIIGGWLLFSMGIAKPTITFKMDGSQGQSVQNAAYSMNALRMDSGSNTYPKTFDGYCVERGAFDEYGNSSLELKKGSYDLWISRDGVSGHAGSLDITNAFDKDLSVNTENVESGMLWMVMLHVRDQDGDPVVAEHLLVADDMGNEVRCTPYGEAGCYIAILPDSEAAESIITLTVQAAGYEACEIELDFDEGRIADEKIKLKSK